MSTVAAAEVFGPARLGPAGLRNRVIKAATFEGLTPHGLVTDELIEFARPRALMGLDDLGSAAVRAVGLAPPRTLRAGLTRRSDTQG